MNRRLAAETRNRLLSADVCGFPTLKLDAVNVLCRNPVENPYSLERRTFCAFCHLQNRSNATIGPTQEPQNRKTTQSP